MAGVAGANIANAAGRPDAAGDPISAAVVQDPIGAYVQDADNPTANTNYTGVNVLVAYDYNALGEAIQPDFFAEATQGAAAGETVQWVQAAGVIAEDGTCTVTAGVATAGAGAVTCLVVGGVVADDYFWAVL